MSGPTFRTRLAKRVARNPGERLASCGPRPRRFVEAEDYVSGHATDWSTVADSTRGRFRLHSSRDVTNLLPDGVPLDRRDWRRWWASGGPSEPRAAGRHDAPQHQSVGRRHYKRQQGATPGEIHQRGARREPRTGKQDDAPRTAMSPMPASVKYPTSSWPALAATVAALAGKDAGGRVDAMSFVMMG
jgi:hypothetical protein